MSDSISRADAIERIVNDNVVGGMDRINEYRNSNEHNDYLDGISCAIATVDDVPSAETHEIRTETHGVCLISKDDAIKAVSEAVAYGEGFIDVLKALESLPSAEASQNLTEPNKELKGSGYISRADAIGAVHEYYQKRFTEDSKWDADAKMFVLEDKTIAKDNMEICNIINALPSAEAEWIPCSERLPRTGDDILVTFSDGEVDIIWSARPQAWVKYEEANNLIFPVAWMPLPKPYREDGEQE